MFYAVFDRMRWVYGHAPHITPPSPPSNFPPWSPSFLPSQSLSTSRSHSASPPPSSPVPSSHPGMLSRNARSVRQALSHARTDTKHPGRVIQKRTITLLRSVEISLGLACYLAREG